MYVGEDIVIPDVAYATAAIRSHTLPLTSVLRFPLETLDGRERKILTTSPCWFSAQKYVRLKNLETGSHKL